MTPLNLARLLVPLFLALGVSLYLDRAMAARRLLPPGFARSPVRRVGAIVAVAALLWAGVFAALGTIGTKVEIDPTKLSTPGLFLLHVLMLLTAGIWFLLGFAGEAGNPAVRRAPASELEAVLENFGEPPVAEAIPTVSAIPVVPPSLGRRFAQQFGLVAPSVPQELGLGLGLGFAAWAAVLAVLVVVALALAATGQTEVTPKELPAMIPWLASRPFLLRLGISLSAGFVEELFFRGFLQPRVGILLSTALFTLAHLSYGQPFMLIGIALLSLIYGLIVRWRQSIWAAVAAHSLFDGIQLLILVPGVVRFLGAGAKEGGTALLTLLGLLGLC